MKKGDYVSIKYVTNEKTNKKGEGKGKRTEKNNFFLGGLLLVIILSFYKIGFFLKFSKEGENV